MCLDGYQLVLPWKAACIWAYPEADGSHIIGTPSCFRGGIMAQADVLAARFCILDLSLPSHLSPFGDAFVPA